jgi:DNA-binding transcriptional LysR family regulator
MKLSQCSALVAITDSGSFTKAARVLGISQSAVSHAIAGLEAELGCALMQRDRAGVRLTDAGRNIVVHARVMVEHAEQIRHVAGTARTGLCGMIRFATSQSFATRLLPTLMSQFRARFPHEKIELREGSDQQIAEWLRGHAVDIGVVTLPKADLTTVPLLRDEMYVLLATGHPLAAAPSVHIDQLAEELLLMPVGGVEPVLRAALRIVGLEPSVAYRMRDLNALLAMVAEGLGITVLPALALPLAPRGVKIVPLTPTVTRQVALGVHDMAQGLPAVTAFIGIARELGRHGDWRLPLSA